MVLHVVGSRDPREVAALGKAASELVLGEVQVTDTPRCARSPLDRLPGCELARRCWILWLAESEWSPGRRGRKMEVLPGMSTRRPWQQRAEPRSCGRGLSSNSAAENPGGLRPLSSGPQSPSRAPLGRCG